ncbi:MAG: hypothetical protein WKF47_13845 [Geodermatophilaceae bacterium]
MTVSSVDPTAVNRFAVLVEQRADRIPLQHLTGRGRLPLPGAGRRPGRLRPAPGDRAAGRRGRSTGCGRIPRPLVADLCTGSGAIALAIAHELPGRRGLRRRSSTSWRWPGPAATPMREPPRGTGAITLHPGRRRRPADPGRAGRRRSTPCVTNPPYVPDDADRGPEVAEHDPPLRAVRRTGRALTSYAA